MPNLQRDFGPIGPIEAIGTLFEVSVPPPEGAPGVLQLRVPHGCERAAAGVRNPCAPRAAIRALYPPCVLRIAVLQLASVLRSSQYIIYYYHIKS